MVFDSVNGHWLRRFDSFRGWLYRVFHLSNASILFLPSQFWLYDGCFATFFLTVFAIMINTRAAICKFRENTKLFQKRFDYWLWTPCASQGEDNQRSVLFAELLATPFEDQSIIAKTTCKLFSSVIPGVSIIAQFVLACLPFLNNCLLRVFEPRSNIFVLTFGFKEPLLPDEVPTGTLDGDGPLLTADISHSARCWGQRGWLYPRWKIRWIFCWKRR